MRRVVWWAAVLVSVTVEWQINIANGPAVILCARCRQLVRYGSAAVRFDIPLRTGGLFS